MFKIALLGLFAASVFYFWEVWVVVMAWLYAISL